MNSNQGKLIVISAPSGTGKTTLVRYLLAQEELRLSFSVSVTTRARRKNEIDGEHYHFLSLEEFFEKRDKGEFLEWEEVYPGTYYGTLHRSVEELWEIGRNVIFDIDVVGGLNVKKRYPEQTLAIFVQPPDIETLRKRLEKRGEDTAEVIDTRIAKAEREISYAPQFDRIIVNSDLETAKKEAYDGVREFVDSPGSRS